MNSVKFFIALSLLMFLPDLIKAQNMSKYELQAIYMNYFREYGFFCEVDKDGDVKFRYEGDTYYIIIDESDAEFFRIIKDYNLNTTDQYERNKVLKAINYATKQTKVGKMFIMNDNVVRAAIEMLYPNQNEFRQTFSRCMRIIKTLEEKFKEGYSQY